MNLTGILFFSLLVLLSPAAVFAEGVSINIKTGDINQGESLAIDVIFTDDSGNLAEHVNYNIIASQAGVRVLDDQGAHEHVGKGSHMTAPLPSSETVLVTVTFLGYGINEPFSGQIHTKTFIVKAASESSAPITVTTDKTSYSDGDTVRISGTVFEVSSAFQVSMQIYSPDGVIVYINQVNVDQNGSYGHEVTAGGLSWDMNGIYKIIATYGTEERTAETTFEFKKNVEQDLVPPLLLVPQDMVVKATDNQGARVEYSVKSIDGIDGVIEPFCNPRSGYLFPIGDSVVTCQSFDSSGNNIQKSFIITVHSPSTFVIPDWIMEVAGFWCNDQIDDPSFIEAIQYLIENRVILVPITESGSGTSQIVPSWIKNNACWWSQGLISDGDFASGVEYLIQQGIIKV